MSAQIPCVHCATRSEYQAEDLHLSLVPIGEGQQILRFACAQCGRPNSQSIGEEYAERLTDMGVATNVVASSPELEENHALRQGNIYPPFTAGYIGTFETMSEGSFNRILFRHLDAMTEGNSHA